PNRFPPDDALEWHVPKVVSATSAGGATVTPRDDGSILLSDKNPAEDTYTLVLDTDRTDVVALRLEALTDPSLPSTGPGRTPHGNFVLSEVHLTAEPRGKPIQMKPIKLVHAKADISQDGFPVGHAIDGDPKTGWAIHTS